MSHFLKIGCNRRTDELNTALNLMSDNSGLGGEIKSELTNATTCIEKVIDNIPSISADTFNSAIRYDKFDQFSQ